MDWRTRAEVDEKALIDMLLNAETQKTDEPELAENPAVPTSTQSLVKLAVTEILPITFVSVRGLEVESSLQETK